PVAHWLGTDDGDVPVHNPIRQVIPDGGFFVARHAVPATLVQQLSSGVPLEGPGHGTGSGEPYLCDRAEAVRLCGELSEREGVRVTLLPADCWEMAFRGTDGRRYP